MSNLNTVKQKIRKSKWGFLAEMIGETSEATAVVGVNHQGVLLVNPRLANELDDLTLIERIRHEFRTAQELRDSVRGFR